MGSKYAAVHEPSKLTGPGDARPTAQQIVDDNSLKGELVGKVALVTGCSSGIGIETARALKSTGATVYVTVRNREKGEKALADLLEPGKFEIVICDQNSLASVEQCAKDFLAKSSTLNILVNNAGIMAVTNREETEDGFESQFGVCHLAHFLLFMRLKNTLLASATSEFPSRVVSVSSVGHRGPGVNFEDIQLEKEGAYAPWVAYSHAKTANIYFANEIERRYGSKNLHAFSLHPGGIWTGLQKHTGQETLGKGNPDVEKTMKSVEQGAATSVWAALDKDLADKGGLYLEDCQIAKAADPGLSMFYPGYGQHAYNPEGEKKLWVESCKMVKIEDDA